MKTVYALATAAFEGAPDGEAFPRVFVPGDPVSGALASVMIELGVAKKCSEKEYDAALTAQTEADTGQAEPADLDGLKHLLLEERRQRDDAIAALEAAKATIAALEAEVATLRAAAEAAAKAAQGAQG